MSFTAVHIPDFPVAALLRSRNDLRTQPVVILEGTPPLEKVISLNTPARTFGVELGMSKVQAQAGCIGVFRNRELREETTAFQAVVAVTDRFSPRVEAIAAPHNAYAEGPRLDALLLIDSRGTGTLFGTIDSYANRLHAELNDASFAAKIGAAPNAEAALLLARSTQSVVCADAKNLRQLLAPLSVAHLPCDPNLLAKINRWGVQTLGQLSQFDEADLISRVGQQGKRLLQFTRGEAEHLLVPEEPAFTLSEFKELEYPLADREQLLFELSPMLVEIMRKAVHHAYALRSIKLTLQVEKLPDHVILIRPALPTQNRDQLLKLLNLDLQTHPPEAEVNAIGLDAEATQPLIAQRGLFQSQFPDPEKLDLLMARLRSTVGEHNVGSPVPANSHRPDAFTMAVFRPEHATRKPEQRLFPRNALRVFRPPQSISIRLTNDAPSLFFLNGTKFQVAQSAGPWHSDGSWWDGNKWDCDFWDVLTTEPVRAFRLCHKQATKVWFAVGVYD